MAKAGRPKKGSAGLPEWFDIQKYAPSHSFGAAEWHAQLTFRKRVFEHIEICQQSDDKGFKPLKQALSLLHEDPLITEQRVMETHSFVEKADIQKPNALQKDIHAGRLLIDPVVGMTVAPVAHSGINLISNGQLSGIKLQETNKKNTLIFHNDGTYELHEAHLQLYGNPIVAIDLSLKDEILLREMRDLLKALRKEAHAPTLPFVKNSDFLKWYKSGVLPYLDLLIWEKMGHAFVWASFIKELSQILDAPISSESAAIKSIQNYAEKLLDEETLRTLAAQVSREQSHTAKKSGKFLVR